MNIQNNERYLWFISFDMRSTVQSWRIFRTKRKPITRMRSGFSGANIKEWNTPAFKFRFGFRSNYTGSSNRTQRKKYVAVKVNCIVATWPALLLWHQLELDFRSMLIVNQLRILSVHRLQWCNQRSWNYVYCVLDLLLIATSLCNTYGFLPTTCFSRSFACKSYNSIH